MSLNGIPVIAMTSMALSVGDRGRLNRLIETSCCHVQCSLSFVPPQNVYISPLSFTFPQRDRLTDCMMIGYPDTKQSSLSTLSRVIWMYLAVIGGEPYQFCAARCVPMSTPQPLNTPTPQHPNIQPLNDSNFQVSNKP